MAEIPSRKKFFVTVFTWAFALTTSVVFFILIYPYILGWSSDKGQNYSIVKLPDVSSTSQSGTSDTTQRGIFFYIKTPKLEIAAPIVDGVGEKDLYQGIGHHPGTPWPKDIKGNVILVGHSSWTSRDNPYGFVFKNLNKLNVGDEIQIKYPDKTYYYKVKSKNIIDPDDTSLFTQKVFKPTLTVYTCSPVYTNWKRLVYTAEME